MPTAAEVRQALYSGQRTVPFHEHLGVIIEQGPSGPLAKLTPKPEIVDGAGCHSPAAVYTLGDIVSSLRLCDELIPRALELDMGAVLFTVSSSFRMRGPARGTIEASASMIDSFDADVGGPGQAKKTTLGVEATIVGEDGEPVGEQRCRFYVRFMAMSRVRVMAPESSLIFGLHDL